MDHDAPGSRNHIAKPDVAGNPMEYQVLSRLHARTYPGAVFHNATRITQVVVKFLAEFWNLSYEGGVAVFRRGLKNGVLTTVAGTR